ncbi:MAG: MFS transporter [Treponema sp.]|nr:MFS transporter [Treponema sp.]MCL2271546.1 MFS transporter [Treponema sp.]
MNKGVVMQENKLNVKVTLLLSFGFFASSIAWSVYNSFVPQILEGFISSTMLIGLVMTVDNVFGVIFQPLFGNLSDKTRTRFGKRMPYIFIGIPVCAAAFALIPYMNTLWTIMVMLIIFTFVMSAWRSPVVALMPDLTPGPLRSQANGIVNLMGGVGSVFAFLLGGILFNFWLNKTGNGFPLPFIMSSAMMLLALAVLALFVREPKQAYEPENKTNTVKLKLDKDEKKSLLLILFGVFLWFTGYNAVETFFTLYATNTLGMTAGDAAMTLSIFSITFLTFAVPAGFIGARIGRRKAILIGLSGVTVLFLPLAFIADAWAARICLFLGGFSWALVNINSLPMVVRISGEEKIGTFIGYYYFFSFSSQIVSPVLFGFIRDLTGSYKTLFLYACIAFALAMASLFFVRHGEDQTQSTSAVQVLDEMGD